MYHLALNIIMKSNYHTALPTPSLKFHLNHGPSSRDGAIIVITTRDIGNGVIPKARKVVVAEFISISLGCHS